MISVLFILFFVYICCFIFCKVPYKWSLLLYYHLCFSCHDHSKCCHSDVTLKLTLNLWRISAHWDLYLSSYLFVCGYIPVNLISMCVFCVCVCSGRGGLVGGISKWENRNVSLQFHQRDPDGVGHALHRYAHLAGGAAQRPLQWVSANQMVGRHPHIKRKHKQLDLGALLMTFDVWIQNISAKSTFAGVLQQTNMYCLFCVVVGKDSPGSESDGGDSRSETGSGEIQPKKVIHDVQCWCN